MLAAALWIAVTGVAAELGQRWWPLHGGAYWLPALWWLASARWRIFACLLPDLAGWRDPAAWSTLAARLAMLPMMAALPAMTDWCSAGGLPPAAVLALHGAVMLLPPLLLPARPGLVAALMLAGGAALVAWPGLQGLSAAMLLHGAAWSLAHGVPPPVAATRPRAAWLAALALPAFGLLLGALGPPALVAVHAGLAMTALAGLGLRPPHNAAHGRALPPHHP